MTSTVVDLDLHWFRSDPDPDFYTNADSDPESLNNADLAWVLVRISVTKSCFFHVALVGHIT
jgi:hypothetical protein